MSSIILLHSRTLSKINKRTKVQGNDNPSDSILRVWKNSDGDFIRMVDKGKWQMDGFLIRTIS